jgi:hypothetical protein
MWVNSQFANHVPRIEDSATSHIGERYTTLGDVVSGVSK